MCSNCHCFFRYVLYPLLSAYNRRRLVKMSTGFQSCKDKPVILCSSRILPHMLFSQFYKSKAVSAFKRVICRLRRVFYTKQGRLGVTLHTVRIKHCFHQAHLPNRQRAHVLIDNSGRTEVQTHDSSATMALDPMSFSAALIHRSCGAPLWVFQPPKPLDRRRHCH